MRLLLFYFDLWDILWIFLGGVLVGFLIQQGRVKKFMRKHRQAESDKLKLNAQLLGLESMYVKPEDKQDDRV